MVFRTQKMYNSLGIVAPVMQMAVADMASGSTSLSWSSEQVGEGLASLELDLKNVGQGTCAEPVREGQ